MAGKLPLFASAPRCKITVNGQDVAYAVGLNVSASVQIQEVRILGEFVVQSLETVSYAPVSGSFQIVRLLEQDQVTQQVASAQAIATSLQGQLQENTGAKVAQHNSIPLTGNFNQGLLLEHLDPRKVLLSQSFDLEIKLKVPKFTQTAAASGSVAAQTSLVPGGTDFLVSFLKVIDCRLTGSSMNISPGQLLTQSLEFQGLLMVNTARGAGFEEKPDTAIRDGSGL